MAPSTRLAQDGDREQAEHEDQHWPADQRTVDARPDRRRSRWLRTMPPSNSPTKVMNKPMPTEIQRAVIAGRLGRPLF